MASHLFAAHGIEKKFGTVRALTGIDFDIDAGEIVALIGDNGAGKSTLTKVLSGVLAPDAGRIVLDGEEVTISSPRRADELGIATLHQDLSLAPHLTVTENLFLGRERKLPGVLGALGLVDSRRMAREAVTLLRDVRSAVTHLDEPVARMSGGQRQSVAIARSVALSSKVLILDEPTSALGVTQVDSVLDTMRRVRDKGLAVVFITHTLPHVMEVADRVQVLRGGSRVASLRTADTSMVELVSIMTGAHAA